MISPLAVTVSALVFLAETGLNYRRYKKGKITKSEFKKLVAEGAIGTVGGLVGTTAGAALGFSVGTLILPVVGSRIGAGIGAVGGFIAGHKLSVRAFAKIEHAIS